MGRVNRRPYMTVGPRESERMMADDEVYKRFARRLLDVKVALAQTKARVGELESAVLQLLDELTAQEREREKYLYRPQGLVTQLTNPGCADNYDDWR